MRDYGWICLSILFALCVFPISDVWAVQAGQGHGDQGLSQAILNIETLLKGPISKLVIYSVFTLTFVASLAKQNTFGAIFSMLGAFAYHQMCQWVNTTFTLTL